MRPGTTVVGILAVVLLATCTMPYENPHDPGSGAYQGVDVYGSVDDLTLLTPDDGAFVESLDELLVSRIRGAEYCLQVNDTDDFSSTATLLLDRPYGPSEHFVLPDSALVLGETYYWRARARTEDAESEWSTPFSFTLYEVSAPTLGSWSSSYNAAEPGLITARGYPGLVAVGDLNGTGRLYAIGGETSSGTSLSSIEYLNLSNGAPTGSWTSSATSLPSGVSRAGTATVDIGGTTYAYIVGGRRFGQESQTVYYAPVDTASIGPFSTTTSLPLQTVEDTVGTFTNDSGSSYAFGTWYREYIGSGETDSYSFTAASSGTYTFSWRDRYTSGSQFTDINGWIYDDGSSFEYFDDEGSESFTGRSGQIRISIEPYSTDGRGDYEFKIEVTGATPTGAQPIALTAGSVGSDTWLYAVGRSGSTTVYRARVTDDGSLESWIADSRELPNGRDGAAAAVVEIGTRSYLYVVGGDGDGSTVYAEIRDDGSLGEWTEDSSHLSYGESRGALFVRESGGLPWLIYAGGQDSSGWDYDEVFTTAVLPDASLAGWEADGTLAAAAVGSGRAVLTGPNGSELYLAGGIRYDSPISDVSRTDATSASGGAPAPAIDPGDTEFSGTLAVTISDPAATWGLSSDATVYYTTDGTTPTSGDTAVTGDAATISLTAGSVTETISVKAIAVAPGGGQSAVTSRTYTAHPAASTTTMGGIDE